MWGFSATFLLIVIGVVSSSDPSSTIDPRPTTQATNATNTTAKPTNATTTTAKPPTTTVKPNATTTTAKPSTTTVKPNETTTTAKPSTTTVKPNVTTTTAKPSTTTPKPSTTTAKPATTTPKPATSGDYSYQKNGIYCLLAKMDAVFTIQYKAKEDNKTVYKNATIQMPMKKGEFDVSKSTCGPTPDLNIQWKKFYTLEMKFENGSQWKVSSLMFTAVVKDNPVFNTSTDNTTITVNVNETELSGLKAGFQGYYTCDAQHTYPFEGKRGQVVLKDVKLEPFGVKTNTTEMFGTEYNCIPTTPTPAKKGDDDKNIVPIAVGCALAGLVLIVLIAYIIGRRKSQRGYEKV